MADVAWGGFDYSSMLRLFLSLPHSLPHINDELVMREEDDR